MSESITHLNKVLVESKGIKTYPQGPLSPLNITKILYMSATEP